MHFDQKTNYIKMKLQMLQDPKNCGPPPLILFNTNPTIGKNHDEKHNPLKVDIKTQQGEAHNETDLLYIPIFKTGLDEALLKLLILLKKTLMGQNLTTGTQCYEND